MTPATEASRAEAGESRGAGRGPRERWRETRERMLAWPGRHPRATRALLVLALFLSGLALFPRQAIDRRSEYRLGAVLPKPIIAEADFTVLKDPEQLRREQAEAMAAVPPVLAKQDSIAAAALAALEPLERSLESLRRDQRGARAIEEGGVPLSPGAYAVLLGERSAEAIREARRLLREHHARGVISEETEARLGGHPRVALVESGVDWVGPAERLVTAGQLRRARETAAGPFDRTVAELVERFAWPNVRWDEQATEERRLLARDAVDPGTERIVKGEAILAAHKRIFPEDLRRLEAYEQFRQRSASGGGARERTLVTVGRCLLLLIGIALHVFFLISYRRRVLAEARDLLLLTSIQVAGLLLAGLVLNVFRLSPYLIPVAAFAVLIALLFDEPLAITGTAFLTLAIGLLGNAGTDFMLIVGLGALAAIRSVRELQDRRQLYRLLLFVPLVHIVALGAVGMLRAMPIDALLADGLYLVANPFIAAGIALFAVPLTEALFEKCTNLTLLELLDLNRPLLRRLMLEAPGTYHHSLMVGTLAEAGAARIGANPLLARVVGYYHDIGKLSKPDYFIENQVAGRRNPHDRLSPAMSRLILEAHVRDGVALAREFRLPRVVRDGIEQHHATGRMTYFLHKARQRDPQVPESEYRYPGPAPRSREAAVLLLADQIDAASRSLEDPTPSRLRGVVKQVIESRAAEGELDESQLTLRDLAQLRESFVPILTALFHGRASGRIVYPRLEHARGQSSGSHSESPA